MGKVRHLIDASRSVRYVAGGDNMHTWTGDSGGVLSKNNYLSMTVIIFISLLAQV